MHFVHFTLAKQAFHDQRSFQEFDFKFISFGVLSAKDNTPNSTLFYLCLNVLAPIYSRVLHFVSSCVNGNKEVIVIGKIVIATAHAILCTPVDALAIARHKS